MFKLRDYNITPKIIHWSGQCKPWYNINVPYQKLWDSYNNNM